jgi:DNA-binding MarR family transcriptional regulator
MPTTHKRKPASKPESIDAVHTDLYDQPGHLLRRAHQIALAVYEEHVGSKATPREYAVLRMVHERPGIDQVGLAGLIGVDTSSTALTAAKLAERGMLKRVVSETDRRLLSLTITARGEQLLEATVDGVHKMREKLLSSLPETDRELFLDMLRRFVHVNNQESRAPMKPTRADMKAQCQDAKLAKPQKAQASGKTSRQPRKG